MSDEAIVYIDPDLEDLIPDFLENRRNDVATIGELLQSGDFKEIRRLGHSMKGSGGGYGFNEITEIGKVIEEAALAEDVSAIERINNHLLEYLGKVKIVWQEED